MCDQQCCSMFWCTVFMFTGIAQLGIGIWYAADPKIYYIRVIENPDVIDDKMIVNSIILGMCCLGSFIFISGIVGMSGVGCRSRNTLIAFTVMGALGIIGTLACGCISAARYAKDLNDEDFGPNIQHNLAELYNNSSATDDFTEAWNSLQYRYECCGYEDFHDYDKGAFANSTGLVAPWTCCVRNKDEDYDRDITNIVDLDQCRAESATNPPGNQYFNSEGCDEMVDMLYFRQHVSLLSISWSAFVIQLIALILSGCLRSDLKEGWMV